MNQSTRGHRLGYTRVSSEDQNTIRQLDGLSSDKVFTDKVSGGNAHDPAGSGLAPKVGKPTPATRPMNDERETCAPC